MLKKHTQAFQLPGVVNSFNYPENIITVSQVYPLDITTEIALTISVQMASRVEYEIVTISGEG